MSEQLADNVGPTLQPPLTGQDEVNRLNSDVSQEMMTAAANTHRALTEEKEAILLEQPLGPGGYTREEPEVWAGRIARGSVERKSEDPDSGLDLDAYKRVGAMVGEAQDLNTARDELIAANIDVSQIAIDDVPQAVNTLRSYNDSVRYVSNARSQLEQAERRLASNTEALSALPVLPKESADQTQS